MISFQQFILDIFQTHAHKHHCNLVQEATFANGGNIYAYVADSVFPIAWLSYKFQAGHNTVCFNGNPLGPDETSYLFTALDGDTIDAMGWKWRQLIIDGLDAGEPVETPTKKG